MAVTWRRIVLRCAAACALGAATEAPVARAQAAQRADTAAEEVAIRSVMARAAEAFNNHDAAAAASFYAPDADLVNVRGDLMKGSAEIERGLARAFTTRYRDATMKRGEIRIRFVRPDVALAYVTNEISGVPDASGGKAPAQRELGMRVFVKDGGVWRIAALHNTPLPGGDEGK